MDYSNDNTPKKIDMEIYEDFSTPEDENIAADLETEENIPVVEEGNKAVGIDISAMPFVLRHEDEIITYIKDKATKETLKSLAPLLEKLEEAVKQQREQEGTSVMTANPPVLNYDEQLKNMQEMSKEKIRSKELKIAERMGKLQVRLASIRK